MSGGKVLVFRDLDGTWSVVRGSFETSLLDDVEYPTDWIAEGVGTWERAMRIANESRVPSTSGGEGT